MSASPSEPNPAEAPGTNDPKPIDIVASLTALLVCQLAGEVIVLSARQFFPALAFPGPVVGMGLMFVVLAWRRGPGVHLDATASAILRNLSLLFVPAAVGIVQYGTVLAQFGLTLALALVVSTVLTLIVTVSVFVLLAGRSNDG